MFKKLFPALFAAALIVPSAAFAQAKPEVKLGFAKCAHCVPMALTPELTKDAKIDAINFNTGNDVLTALVSKSIDVAQITYLHYITALDRGFDVVAISGQVNGGSDILIKNSLNLKPDDWAGLKAVIAKYKAEGKPFRIAASRGNAQDIHMRGELMAHGIDPNKDVEFINIPNPSDHGAALRRGEVELICTVEPFASQIRMAGEGKHFSLPYDQPAGNLTNLIVTRSDVIKNDPQGVKATVGAVVKLVDKLKGDRKAWVDVIGKYTAMDPKIANEALKNAFPDYKMHRKQAEAVAAMMKNLKYISHDVTSEVGKHMDYSFLTAVTGKSKTELGY